MHKRFKTRPPGEARFYWRDATRHEADFAPR